LERPNDEDPVLLEHLKALGKLHPFVAFLHGAHVDALFQGAGTSLPPAIILDYMYGVATYHRWGNKQSHSVVDNYFIEHYKDIPAPPHRPSSHNDDPSDGSNNPPPTRQQAHHTSTRRGDIREEAMDELSLVLMLLQGTTPEEAANRWENQMKEELKAQEASQSKVLEWMKTTDIGDSYIAV
jgi:hypothetical protein